MGRGPVSAFVCGAFVPGEYAAGGVLGLPLLRGVQRACDPLSGGEARRAAALRAGLVRLRLLDRYGPGPAALQAAPGTPAEGVKLDALSSLRPLAGVRRRAVLAGPGGYGGHLDGGVPPGEPFLLCLGDRFGLPAQG